MAMFSLYVSSNVPMYMSQLSYQEEVGTMVSWELDEISVQDHFGWNPGIFPSCVYDPKERIFFTIAAVFMVTNPSKPKSWPSLNSNQVDFMPKPNQTWSTVMT